MRAAQIGILGVGLALAGFGVYMAQNYVNQTRAAMAAVAAHNASLPTAMATTMVLVANRPIRYGEPILSLIHISEPTRPY